MALQWARDASSGGADQCRDRRSCPANGGHLISRRRQDEIANKSPIAMEKQSGGGFRNFANNLTGEMMFRELNRDAETTHSDLRRWGDGGCSRKFRDAFSSDMETATEAAAMVFMVLRVRV
ncbi:hypothetical protein TIFTF001_010491 [Ficus carica]|uniref:Uncharacterized protein n=1 Tax=Ficus carica TaxID=3494 RepID=A0AA88A8R7_FICCA|nr:hypothetical protein TIFTF001_010491 [Ficus carica]